MSIIKRAAFAAVILASVSIALLASACSDDSPDSANGSSNASQSSIDQLTARLQQDEMLYALVSIEALELHEIDDSIQEGSPLERAVPDVRKFVRIMALTDWAPDVSAEAQEVHDKGVALLQALDEGDVEAAKGPSEEAHEGFHDFADRAWNVVVRDLAPDEGGREEHAEDEETPMADETPAGEATP